MLHCCWILRKCIYCVKIAAGNAGWHKVLATSSFFLFFYSGSGWKTITDKREQHIMYTVYRINITIYRIRVYRINRWKTCRLHYPRGIREVVCCVLWLGYLKAEKRKMVGGTHSMHIVKYRTYQQKE